jgi:hypothetical protein
VSQHDDNSLLETRWASAAIVAILVPAFVVLWCRPSHTATEWAWTIKPGMTPVFMGSAYGAGAYFFARAALGRRWPPVAAGVLSAAAFAALMLVVTLIHLDRFNHGDAPTAAAIAYYGWVGVYIASPVLVGALWLRNRRTDGGHLAPGDAVVPPTARMVMRVVGVAALVAAAVFLVSPATAMHAWPWKLTPLTARVVGCFTAQVGLGALALSLDSRWSAWRVLLQTFLVATTLLLIGTARQWGDFDSGRPVTWLFIAGLLAPALAILALFRAMRRPG